MPCSIIIILTECFDRINFTQIVDIDSAAKSVAEGNGHAYYEGTIETFNTDKRFDLILMTRNLRVPFSSESPWRCLPARPGRHRDRTRHQLARAGSRDR